MDSAEEFDLVAVGSVLLWVSPSTTLWAPMYDATSALYLPREVNVLPMALKTVALADGWRAKRAGRAFSCNCASDVVGGDSTALSFLIIITPRVTMACANAVTDLQMAGMDLRCG